MKYLIEKLKDNFRKNEYALDDRYCIHDGKIHDFAIIAPGGGYGFVSSFNEGVPFAEELNKRGISAFIVFYRVKDKATFPNPTDDLADSLKTILSNKDKYKVSDNYFLIGSSAGAHLVATFSYLNQYKNLLQPKGLILAYPVITMDKELTHSDSRRRLIGDNPSEELIKLTSVECNITPSYPPTFIFVGENDKTVDIKNSLLMVEALKNNNVDYKYKSYPKIGHGVGLAKNTIAENWFNEAVDFMISK